MKRLILLILLFLFVSLCSAIEIGLSPPEITFNISEGETLCENLTLFSTNPLMFSGQDLWSERSSRNLNDYSNEKNNTPIISYTKRMLVNQKKIIPVCISAPKQGTYYSALIYTAEQGSASIGTWIIIDIKSKTNKITLNSFLTGSAIGDSPNTGYIFLILLASLLFLLVILLFILYKQR